jgi:hypothetical protein
MLYLCVVNEFISKRMIYALKNDLVWKKDL